MMPLVAAADGIANRNMFTRLPGADDDDRDGVGCFLKENRTLWLGGVPVIDEASSRERVRHNFEAWGRISSIRLVKNKVQTRVTVGEGRGGGWVV